MQTRLLTIGEMPVDYRIGKSTKDVSENLINGSHQYHNESSYVAVDAEAHNASINCFLSSNSIKGLSFTLQFNETATECWSVDGHTNELIKREIPAGGLHAVLSSWYEDLYSANHPFARSEYNLTIAFIALKLKSGWVAIYSSDLVQQYGSIRITSGQDKTTLDFYLEKELSSTDLPYNFPSWKYMQADSLDSLISTFESEVNANRPSLFDDSYRLLDKAIYLHAECSYGEPLLTFNQMEDILRTLQTYCNPPTTLVYIPGWEGPYDMARPKFTPSDACGGETGFSSLCNTADSLGYLIMPHINLTGINPWSELWDDFKDCITRNHNNEERWWRYDVDGDGREEAYLAYINPAYQKWNDYFAGSAKSLIELYKLKAIYLDQTSLFWNDPNANYYRGKAELLTRLILENPAVLIGGEGIVQSLLPYTPVIQMMLPNTISSRTERRTLFKSSIGRLPFLTLPAADGSETIYPPRYTYSSEVVEQAYSALHGFDYIPTVALGRGGWNPEVERLVRKVFGK